MTKETIFQQIRNLILPEFENETTKFKSLAISPYHPVIVVEFEKKLKNSEFYQNAYSDCTITKCGKFIWCTGFMHYQVHSFEGLKKLYDQYLKVS